MISVLSRGTVDIVFCVQQLQEKSREQQKPLMFIFWDLRKEFDITPEPVRRATLVRFRSPDSFVSLIRMFHHGTEGRVNSRGVLSDSFRITVGLKQGRVLSLTLFFPVPRRHDQRDSPPWQHWC